MPHISKRKLNPRVLKKLFEKLLSLLEKAQNKKRMYSVLSELFTHTEKVMLAKRLGIALLLASSLPQEKIVKILKVSPTTVSKMSLKMEIGKYKSILEVSQKEKIDIEKLVWNILTVGGIMPPKVGRKYWRKH